MHTPQKYKINEEITEIYIYCMISFFVKLTHCPTMHFQPMMQFSNQVCERMVAPRRMVHLLIHAPSSTTTSGPMVTLGPIRQFFPILAEESTSTLPTTPVHKQLGKYCTCILHSNSRRDNILHNTNYNRKERRKEIIVYHGIYHQLWTSKIIKLKPVFI